MIHIATVHHNNESFIDIQLKYLNIYIKEPYKIYACLNGINKEHFEKYYFSVDYTNPRYPAPNEKAYRLDILSIMLTRTRNISLVASKNHAGKLNFLASRIIKDADDDDIMIFIDGDAFPIADFLPGIRVKLEKHSLAAINVFENAGQRQPHSSFCATTVGFWKHIDGDWMPGYFWKDIDGRYVTDTGGNLLKKLQEYKVNWFRLSRTNKTNLHHVFFGIYGNMIYHHGAGFRPTRCQRDTRDAMNSVNRRFGYERKDLILIKMLINFIRNVQCIKNAQLSKRVYNDIVENEHFYDMFA